MAPFSHPKRERDYASTPSAVLYPRKWGQMTASEWAKHRSVILAHISRSRKVNNAAFRLWYEIAFGWAWGGENSAFPKVEMLAKALGKGRTTILRGLDDLEALGLITRDRQSHGNVYQLPIECPEALKSSITNANIAASVRGRKSKKKTQGDVPKTTHHDAATVSADVSFSGPCDVPLMGHHPPCDVPLSGHHDVPLMGHQCKYIKESFIKKEKLKKGNLGDPADHPHSDSVFSEGSPSRSALGNEHATQDRDQRSYNESDENKGLSEIACPEGPRSRSKQGFGSSEEIPRSDLAVKTLSGSTGASQRDDHIKSEVGVQSTLVESPTGLLRRLRDEVERRWGARALRGFPSEITPKLAGQIKGVILGRYSPDVIEDMIRLVVWDWEVARGECFPFRKEDRYPSLLALIQYAEVLAGKITTGFLYPSHSRGAVNTYRDLFIEKKEIVDDDDPY